MFYWFSFLMDIYIILINSIVQIRCETMYFGQYLLTLDNNCDISIPETMLGLGIGRMYAVQGFDKNIYLFPEETFQHICANISEMNLTDPSARLMLRLFLGTASEVRPDSKGQVSIPIKLLDFATIKDQLVLVGQGNYFEVWEPDLWNQQEVDIQDSEMNQERFRHLNLKFG